MLLYQRNPHPWRNTWRHWRVPRGDGTSEGQPGHNIHRSLSILCPTRRNNLYFLFHKSFIITDKIPNWTMTWWRHQMETFPHYWPFVRGIHRPPVNSSHNSQWRGALMFSLICAWINGWVNNREAGDLRHHRAHYDVIVMTRIPPIHL